MSGFISFLFSPLSSDNSSLCNITTIAFSPSEFISFMDFYERSIALPYDFQRGILTVQAGLETGWGKKVIDKNLFNIKAGDNYIKNGGSYCEIDTFEYINGIKKLIVAKFRRYDTYAKSILDYIYLIKNSVRYKEAYNNRDNYKMYYIQLQKGGYATDPNYADKLIRLYNQYF